MATNNRFKKSVDSAAHNTNVNIKDSIKDNISCNTTDNILYNAGNNILNDILSSNKKDRGKNHTLYLSAETSDALDSQAKQSNMSKSELVDKILRKVLLNQSF